MKCSIIIPVLESYEAIKRQILYMNTLKIPDNFEIIMVDDGSEPAIQVTVEPRFNFLLIRRWDKRPWTIAIALNAGIRLARGEYIWINGIDHMISEEAMEFMAHAEYPERFIGFPRLNAMLDEDGKLSVFDEKPNLPRPRVYRKEDWASINGYDEDFIEGNHYEDLDFKDRFQDKFISRLTVGPPIFMFPEKNNKRRPNIFHRLQKFDLF